MLSSFSQVSKLVVCGTLLFFLTAVPAKVFSQVEVATLAQYQQIVEPTLAQLEPLVMAVSPVSSPFSLMMVETWRMASLTFLGALQSKVDDAMAKAITTNTVKNVRIGIEPAIQGTRNLIAKLKGDLKWYEDEFGFLPSFPPTDPTDREYWDHYQAILKALKEYSYSVPLPDEGREDRLLIDAEKTLEKQAKEVTEGAGAGFQQTAKGGLRLAELGSRYEVYGRAHGAFEQND